MVTNQALLSDDISIGGLIDLRSVFQDGSMAIFQFWTLETVVTQFHITQWFYNWKTAFCSVRFCWWLYTISFWIKTSSSVRWWFIFQISKVKNWQERYSDVKKSRSDVVADARARKKGNWINDLKHFLSMWSRKSVKTHSTAPQLDQKKHWTKTKVVSSLYFSKDHLDRYP